MRSQVPIESIPGVCEVHVAEAEPGAAWTAPSLLIEVPHGATRREDYERVRRRLASTLPEGLDAFFFVNTDVGAFECAREIARRLVVPEGTAASRSAPRSVVILRSLVPRTFIDCNRIVRREAAAQQGGMTPALPEYVVAAADRAWLEGLHASYQTLAREAYGRVCPAGGVALQLHTYAPRSVDIGRLDAGIVEALRRAYEPGTFETWKRRPDVELISGAGDGRLLASAELVAAMRRSFSAIGIDPAENESYRLHPDTLGYELAVAHPGRVLCLELNRGLLADPFAPFEEMHIGAAKVERLAAPIAAALRTAFAGPDALAGGTAS